MAQRVYCPTSPSLLWHLAHHNLCGNARNEGWILRAMDHYTHAPLGFSTCLIWGFQAFMGYSLYPSRFPDMMVLLLSLFSFPIQIMFTLSLCIVLRLWYPLYFFQSHCPSTGLGFCLTDTTHHHCHHNSFTVWPLRQTPGERTKCWFEEPSTRTHPRLGSCLAEVADELCLPA